MILVGQGATVTDTWDASDDWSEVKAGAIRLLRTRGRNAAADALESFPFQLYEGTNAFNDEFHVLEARVPLPEYIAVEELHRGEPRLFQEIAAVVTEVGPFVRFVTVEVRRTADLLSIPSPTPAITSAAVARALDDAEQLLRTQGPASAFERVHTALHGYLKTVARELGVSTDEDLSLPALFKVVWSTHPSLGGAEPYGEEVRRLLRTAAGIVESLNTFRNKASIAHPNDNLLQDPEAMLAINLARSLLHYLDAKLGAGLTR